MDKKTRKDITTLRDWLRVAFPVPRRVRISFRAPESSSLWGTNYHSSELRGQATGYNMAVLSSSGENMLGYTIYLNPDRVIGEIAHTLIHEWAHLRVGLNRPYPHGEAWGKEYATIYSNYIDLGSFSHWLEDGEVKITGVAENEALSDIN